MNRFLLALALCLFSIALSKAQDLENEVEFKYIKAKYLLDTERYEDAIKAFTDLLEENKGYKDALLLRAQSKYAMAAYVGTKKDVLLHASRAGMNSQAITLLGKADYKLGNSEAAMNSLGLAVNVNEEDPQVSEFLGDLYEENDQMLKACEYWQISAKMGSSKAGVKARKSCGSYVSEVVERKQEPKKSKIQNPEFPPRKTDVEVPTKEDDDLILKDETATGNQKDDTLNNPTRGSVLEKNEEKMQNEDEGMGTDDAVMNTEEDEPVQNEEEPIVEDVVDNLPPDDNTPNEIEIDDDLTLVIRGQGIGKRRILNQPNILILSDEDGIVAVDICVNKRGRVESAEFNSKLSTIAKKMLVSLAIRKSKDFWFEENDYAEQCGVIIFKIKAN